MIEPTAEMLNAYEDAAELVAGQRVRCYGAGLAAALAIVERDYRFTCSSAIDSDRGPIRCTKEAGHESGHRGDHPSAGVFWS